MGKRGKRYKASLGSVDRVKRYDVEEAFNVLKAFKTAKFNESVDVAIKLGVDPKQSDQMVRGVVRMPQNAAAGAQHHRPVPPQQLEDFQFEFGGMSGGGPGHGGWWVADSRLCH